MVLTRRDLLRWGIMLGGDALLSGGQRVSSASDLPGTPFTVKDPFTDALPIAPVKQPAAPFPTTVLPTPPPASVQYFVVDQTLVESHQFHQGKPAVVRALWGYDGQVPGPRRRGSPRRSRYRITPGRLAGRTVPPTAAGAVHASGVGGLRYLREVQFRSGIIF
jgi:hypothetical protein